jgi:hypothetical protein
MSQLRMQESSIAGKGTTGGIDRRYGFFGENFSECLQLFRQTKVMCRTDWMDSNGSDTLEHFQAGQQIVVSPPN